MHPFSVLTLFTGQSLHSLGSFVESLTWPFGHLLHEFPSAISFCEHSLHSRWPSVLVKMNSSIEHGLHTLLSATLSASHATHPSDDDISFNAHATHSSGLSSKLCFTSGQKMLKSHVPFRIWPSGQPVHWPFETISFAAQALHTLTPDDSVKMISNDWHVIHLSPLATFSFSQSIQPVEDEIWFAAQLSHSVAGSDFRISPTGHFMSLNKAF